MESHKVDANDAHSANKALVSRWVEDVFNRRDNEACSAIAADAYEEHAVAPFGQAAPGPVNGPQNLQLTAEWLIAQFPDLHMTIEAMVAEGDTVAVRILSTGTNLGPLNGVMPPTGKPFRATQSHWFRIANGRLAEHWATRDDLGTMLQLGVIPPPAGRRP